MREIRAGYNESGQRLDKLLRKLLPNAADSFIYKMLRKKNIALNDKKAAGSEIVADGDMIRIWFSEETYARFAGEQHGEDGKCGAGACERRNAESGSQGGCDALDRHARAQAARAIRLSDEERADAGRIGTDRVPGGSTETDGMAHRGCASHELLRLREAFDRAVVYEDRDILVINKPAGMLSQKAQPQDISAVELLIDRMLTRGEITREQQRTFHPSVCNRLDRNTSGVLVCGKSLKGLQEMSAMIRARSVKKDYLAVVQGELREGRRIRSMLIKDHATNKVRIRELTAEENIAQTENITQTENILQSGKKAQGHDGGQLIDTEFKPVYTDGERTLVMVRIHTGRTHQIRAQLAALGYPICGDVKYGGGRAYPRQLLHAWSLSLPDGRRFIAPAPDDIKKAIGGYGWEHGRPADFEALPSRI